MKKFRRIFVHTGFDKTGSTSIQWLFDHSRDALAREGFLYPQGAWHAQLGSCFSSRPETYIFNELQGRVDPAFLKQQDDEYLQAFTAELEASSATQLVISYEGFASIDEEGLVRFNSFLAQYSDEVTFIAYCRPPLAYALSALSQRVRSGIEPWIDVPVFPFGDYLAKLGRVAGPGDLVVRALPAEALPEWNVVAEFCALLGLHASFLAETAAARAGPANRALSREAYLIGCKLIALARDRMNSANEHLQKFSAALGAIAGERLVLTTGQARLVMKSAENHLAYLREAHGLRFADESRLISDRPCSLSEETATSIAAELFRLVVNEPPRTLDVDTGDLTLHAWKLREGPRIVRGQAMTFDVDFRLHRAITDLTAGIHIHDTQGRGAFGVNSKLLDQWYRSVPRGPHSVTYHLVADLPLGSYQAGFSFVEEHADGQSTLAWRHCLFQFDVVKSEEVVSRGYSPLPASIELRPYASSTETLVTNAAGELRVVGDTRMQLAPAVPAEIEVEVRNLSEQDWLGDTMWPVCLSYHWRDSAGQFIVFDGLRSHLPRRKIGKGETVQASVAVEPPAEPGKYTLQITLLQEHVGWFEAMGFTPADIEVDVV